MKTEMDISLPDKIFRKNSIDIECHLNLDLSDYKIRAELFDRFYSSLHLYNEAAGGSDDEIEFTDDGEDGNFIIHIAKNTTNLFHLISYLEIEIEDENGKVQTVWFTPIKFEDDIYMRA